MQYNQMMTDTVYSIRSHLTPMEKRTIKTSNPELLEDLAEIYHHSSNHTLRSLIEQLMHMAGVTWAALLKPKLTATIHPIHINKPAVGVTHSQGAVA